MTHKVHFYIFDPLILKAVSEVFDKKGLIIPADDFSEVRNASLLHPPQSHFQFSGFAHECTHTHTMGFLYIISLQSF